jgi:hypothetical protein
VWPQCTQVLVLTLVLVAMQVRVRAIALNRCWFQIDGEQSTSRKTHGVQHKATSFEPRINYFRKLTQPSRFSLSPQVDATRTVILMRSTGNRSTGRKSAPRSEIACSAQCFHVSDSTTVPEGLSPYSTRVAHPGVTSSPSKLIGWSTTSDAATARAGAAAPARRRAAGMNPAAMAFG